MTSTIKDKPLKKIKADLRITVDSIHTNQINNIINYGLENLINLEEWSKDETLEKFSFLSFSDTTWASSTITARGALIYKSGGTNPSIAVLDFGADKSSSNSTFKVEFPTASDTTAILRIG